jgi:hypothetical protein
MIAYVYRPKRQRNGKLVSSRIWRARLKLNGDVKARDISLGVSDKQVAASETCEITRNITAQRSMQRLTSGRGNLVVSFLL